MATRNLAILRNWIVRRWYVINTANPSDTIHSEQTIELGNEQLIPEWGISIHIQQYQYEELSPNVFTTELISSEIVFADSSKRWLSGVEDADGNTSQNWIRSGTASEDCDADSISLMHVEAEDQQVRLAILVFTTTS